MQTQLAEKVKGIKDISLEGIVIEGKSLPPNKKYVTSEEILRILYPNQDTKKCGGNWGKCVWRQCRYEAA